MEGPISDLRVPAGADDESRYRVGIDVGGTFTDFVLAESRTGRLVFFKEPSTPDEPSRAVEHGMANLLRTAGVKPGAVELVVHGTTIGLNAIIQRRGATTALIVSSGNRDVLEMARHRMPVSMTILGRKEDSLVSRDLVFEVAARIATDGSTVASLDEDEIDRVVATLRMRGVETVAVALLNAYADGSIERQVADAVRRRAPELLVTASSEIWPEIREYERTLVTVLSAYIHPLMNCYFSLLEEGIRKIGVTAPIYITANNGGTIGLDTAKQRAIDTVLSGPASGVVASIRSAALLAMDRIITFDMGGTSSDVAIASNGEPEYTARTQVGDFPLILPVVNVSAIGAGGGSKIWMDDFGILKIGPESAGAYPGPVCYGRGGTVPTITDCYVALGILSPAGFLGGRMTLDREAALAALEPLAARLGFEGADAACRVAEAALDVATVKMAAEVQKICAARGVNLRDYTAVGYGGAGPTHVNRLAAELGMKRIMTPLSPGTFCALGAIMTDLKRDYVRAIRLKVGDDGFAAALSRAAEQIGTQAQAWLSAEGISGDGSRVNWIADMRYAGEAQGMAVPLHDSLLSSADAHGIAEAFHLAHETNYGFREESNPVEMLSLRAQVVAKVPHLGHPERNASEPPSDLTRPVFTGGRWVPATVYRRAALRPRQKLAGPALIEQDDTTVWIAAGWAGEVDPHGLITIEAIADVH